MQFVYSEATHSFIKRLKSYLKDIMKNEMGLVYKTSRFLYGRHTFPLNLVVFENNSQLGHYNPNYYRLGINKRLMYLSKTTVLKDVLRHELAHMFCHITGVPQETPHDENFKAVCQKFGWGENIWKASASIEEQNESLQGDLKSEKLIAKVKKLLALSTSSNEHEAQLATIKANELMINHNLNEIDSGEQNEFILLSALKAKRNSAKLHAISRICTKFFVEPVFNYGKNEVNLEIVGTKSNVLIAEYVCHFLDKKLEIMWNSARKLDTSLKGAKAKNSFFLGIAEGYLDKLTQSQESANFSNRLPMIQGQLQLAKSMAYGRTKSIASNAKSDQSSLRKGKLAGQSLTIHGGISNGGPMGSPKRLPI